MKPRQKQKSGPVSPWYRVTSFPYCGALYGSHHSMLALIPPRSRVLETGCANGRFSRALVERGCRVVGLELDADAAAQAASVCDQVIVGDLEDPAVRAQIPGTFDVLVFGDVLEHLVAPWEVLRALRPRLNRGGALIISIPNIAHWDTRMGLLCGKFDYQEQGLLDATHLRFFTRRTFWEMLEQTGYRIVATNSVPTLPAWVYAIRLVRRVAPRLAPLAARLAPNLFTYQFVVKAVPTPASSGKRTLR